MHNRNAMITLLVRQIVTDVSELPDRTSPDGEPHMMMVTATELANIVRGHLEDSQLVAGGH